MRAFWMMAVALAVGCMAPDPAGPGSHPANAGIPDQNLLAGATSSTNWPPEDAGTQPIQVFGKADSGLAFWFKQAPAHNEEPVFMPLSGTLKFYPAGSIPVFDTLPALRVDFPLTDTLRLDPEIVNSINDNGLDTCIFSVEIDHGGEKGFLPRLAYSKKQKKFLEWPLAINSGNPTLLLDPHYMFAGFPGPDLLSLISDTSGNPGFYYYIPGSPFFWRHSYTDTLFIGPTFYGDFPLRLLKIAALKSTRKEYTIEAFPITLKQEVVSDSLNHGGIRNVFHLGERIFIRTVQGEPAIRNP